MSQSYKLKDGDEGEEERRRRGNLERKRRERLLCLGGGDGVKKVHHRGCLFLQPFCAVDSQKCHTHALGYDDWRKCSKVQKVEGRKKRNLGERVGGNEFMTSFHFSPEKLQREEGTAVVVISLISPLFLLHLSVVAAPTLIRYGRPLSRGGVRGQNLAAPPTNCGEFGRLRKDPENCLMGAFACGASHPKIDATTVSSTSFPRYHRPPPLGN